MLPSCSGLILRDLHRAQPLLAVCTVQLMGAVNNFTKAIVLCHLAPSFFQHAISTPLASAIMPDLQRAEPGRGTLLAEFCSAIGPKDDPPNNSEMLPGRTRAYARGACACRQDALGHRDEASVRRSPASSGLNMARSPEP